MCGLSAVTKNPWNKICSDQIGPASTMILPYSTHSGSSVSSEPMRR